MRKQYIQTLHKILPAAMMAEGQYKGSFVVNVKINNVK